MENEFKPYFNNQTWMEVINPSEIIEKYPLLNRGTSSIRAKISGLKIGYLSEGRSGASSRNRKYAKID